MPRLAVHSQLPRLEAICPDLANPATHGKTAVGIAACLRRVLPRLRQKAESPFYPVRQVAQLAGVSYKTAQRAYRQLAAEGLLRVVRGSQTFLRGRRMEPRRPVRGCVVVPVWMQALRRLPNWRQFYRALETELRRHNLVADFLFYGHGESADPAFAERVLAHYPDQLFWFRPGPLDLPQIRRIADMGIRVTALLDAPVIDFPGRWNRLAKQRALQHAFGGWRREGIESVLLVFDPTLAEIFSRFGALAADAGLRWRSYSRGAGSIATCVRQLGRGRLPQETGLFLHDVVFASLCEHDPKLMARLVRRHRVLLEEPVDLPPDLLVGVRVDYLRVDWPRVARTMARQMAEKAGPAQAGPVTFQARWQPRVAAAGEAW